jgi:hypothetical protein
MIDRSHKLPLTQQAALLLLGRGSLYYAPRPVPAGELSLMRRIDELHLNYPFAGARMLRDLLRTEDVVIGREKVATLMRRMGIEGVYQAAFCSALLPAPQPYRAALGPHAQTSNPQSMPTLTQALPQPNADLPAQNDPRKLGNVLRSGQ